MIGATIDKRTMNVIIAKFYSKPKAYNFQSTMSNIKLQIA